MKNEIYIKEMITSLEKIYDKEIDEFDFYLSQKSRRNIPIIIHTLKWVLKDKLTKVELEPVEKNEP